MNRPIFSAISYDLDGACEATGFGKTTIRAALNDGELIAHYSGIKPVIRAADLDEWVRSLPTETSKRKAS